MSADWVADARQARDVPGPSELLDNVVEWMGKSLRHPGDRIDVLNFANGQALSGCVDAKAFDWLLATLEASGWIDGDFHKRMGTPSRSLTNATLSLGGWTHYQDILRTGSDSRTAFMAMAYGDTELDGIVKDSFTPAVAATGFRLLRLDGEPRAGLIDDRMRVEIRRAHFLVADLTHGNLGAYWEAGFAEGLGKAVVFTCRKDVFDDPARKPHFDTNHHLTVTWHPDTIETDCEVLKAVVRNTFPDHAIMDD